MSTLVTKEAPNFKAQAVTADNAFEELELSSYRGKYVVLFFFFFFFMCVCQKQIFAFEMEIGKFK